MAVGVLMNNYGESEQRVFDSLKTISRNNQRKISSVAQEILAKHSERNYQADDNKQASSLHTWLSNNITVQVR